MSRATPLSASATEASLLRYHAAEEIVRTCPPELGREIALTGSVARGIADQYSDIELSLWVDDMPSREQWWKWLQRLGATEVTSELQADPTGTGWIGFRFRGVWIEAGWQTFPRLEELLERLLAGEVTDHYRLVMANILLDALPLRSEGLLARWQERLAVYPAGLQEKLIQANTSAWSDPHVPHVRWALVQRGDRFVLSMRLLWDMQNALYVLFAINQTWQPDWKWITQAAHELPSKPPRLAERIDEIFTLSEPEKSVKMMFELILDTLALVPEIYDVTPAISSIQQALAEAP